MNNNLYKAILKLETGTHTARISQILTTPDTRTLVTAGMDKTIRVWDVETKNQLRMLLGEIGIGANGIIQRITLSPDGKYVVALARMDPDGMNEDRDRETEIRVYELETGNLQANSHYEGILYDLAFSPDGKYLAVVGNPKFEIDFGAGKKSPAVIRNIEQQARRSRVQVFDASALLQGFDVRHLPVAWESLHDYDKPIPAYIRFAPALPKESRDYRLVVATWYCHPGQDPEYTGGLLWYSFSPEHRLKQLPTSCDTAEGIRPYWLAVSSKFVVVAGDTPKFFCHDHKGKLVATVLTASRPTEPAFSHDERQMVIGQSGDAVLAQVQVYETAYGKFRLKSTYYGHNARVDAAVLRQDGTAVSAGGDRNAIHFWNPSHIEGEQTGIIQGMGQAVHAVGITQDGQIGIGHRKDSRLTDGAIALQCVFDLRTMTLNRLSVAENALFQRAQTHAGEQWLEWESEGNWNLFLKSSENAWGFPLTGTMDPNPPYDFIWYNATTFGFTENLTIVTGDTEGNVRVARRNEDGSYNPLPWRFLVGHTARIQDHAACGRWLVTASADQIVRLWFLQDVEQNSMTDLQPALNLFVGSDDEWVIWSQSGYYNASQRGDRRIGYHINRGPKQEALYFPSDRFIKGFCRPDLIREIIEYGSEERAFAAMAKRESKAVPVDVAQILPPVIEMVSADVNTRKNSVKLKFTVKSLSPDKPVTRVWIIRNDQFVKEYRELKQQYQVPLELLPGRNRIKILAENANAKAAPLIQILWGAGTQGTDKQSVPDNGTLYLLAVGVSKLKYPRPRQGLKDLKFAHTDAIAIYNSFAKQSVSGRLEQNAPLRNKAFQSVDATILLNQKATKNAILRAVDDISAKIHTNQSKRKKPRRDVLFIFLSGHGVRLVNDETEEKDLYFCNHDLKIGSTAASGLSFTELGEKITTVPAEVILASDACHSGMAGKDVIEGLDPNELAKRIYAINERGMYVLNAARGEELAIESPRTDIRHGIFTKSILETLEADGEENLSMMHLISSIQERVQHYTENTQTPTCRMYGDLLPLVIYKK